MKVRDVQLKEEETVSFCSWTHHTNLIFWGKEGFAAVKHLRYLKEYSISYRHGLNSNNVKPSHFSLESRCLQNSCPWKCKDKLPEMKLVLCINISKISTFSFLPHKIIFHIWRNCSNTHSKPHPSFLFFVFPTLNLQIARQSCEPAMSAQQWDDHHRPLVPSLITPEAVLGCIDLFLFWVCVFLIPENYFRPEETAVVLPV